MPQNTPLIVPFSPECSLRSWGSKSDLPPSSSLPPEAVLGGVFPRKLFRSPPHFIDRLSQWIIEVTEITSDPDTTARSKVELSHFVRQSLKLAAGDFFQASLCRFQRAQLSFRCCIETYRGTDLLSQKQTCIPINKICYWYFHLHSSKNSLMWQIFNPWKGFLDQRWASWNCWRVTNCQAAEEQGWREDDQVFWNVSSG